MSDLRIAAPKVLKDDLSKISTLALELPKLINQFDCRKAILLMPQYLSFPIVLLVNKSAPISHCELNQLFRSYLRCRSIVV